MVGFAQDKRQQVEASDEAKVKDKISLELQPKAFKAQARELGLDVLVADKKRQGLFATEQGVESREQFEWRKTQDRQL